MSASFDYKKEYKDLYFPKTKPSIIDVPTMSYIMVDGRGNPNTCEEYKNAIEILYGLSFTIKMSKKAGNPPDGYFDYVVPPLEGFWWVDGGEFDGVNITDKELFVWTSMIRQPEFVTSEAFEAAKASMLKKKPELDLSNTSFMCINEGLCVQIMHIGPYDSEPESISKLNKFIEENGFRNDISSERKHHEIYLGDPRRCAPEKLKTVIRHPVAEI